MKERKEGLKKTERDSTHEKVLDIWLIGYGFFVYWMHNPSGRTWTSAFSVLFYVAQYRTEDG